jgi:DNA replication initiation complex subunit (GINS family)
MELVSSGATLVKLENTTQMQVAVQRPRNEDRVLSAALAELERYPSMADEAIYSKPVGKDPDTQAMKYVEGLSIRAAESLANRWTNSAYACDIVNEDQGTITIAAIFMDYEGNTRHVVQRRVSKFYKKKNSTQIAQYSPDRLDVVVAAAMSKALREVILRSLPAGLKKEYEHKAYKVLDMQPLEQRQIAIVARFKEVGIKRDALETHAGKKIEQLTAEDLKVYTGLLNAIRDGEISAEETLGIKKEEKPADTVKPGITVAGPGDGTAPDSRTKQDPPLASADPPADLPKSTKPSEGEEPFPDPGKEAPKFAWQTTPPTDAGSLIMAANKITSRDEFDVFRKEFQPLIDQMRPGMKVAVEKAITDKQANLF